jgi:hypothetical protein
MKKYKDGIWRDISLCRKIKRDNKKEQGETGRLNSGVLVSKSLTRAWRPNLLFVQLLYVLLASAAMESSRKNC